MSEFATVTDALDYLEDFGDPRLIARELERRGIRAVIGNSEACALAMFVEETMHVESVSVGPRQVLIFDDSWERATDRAATPGQVERFINMFDSGRFPNLVYTRATKEIAA